HAQARPDGGQRQRIERGTKQSHRGLVVVVADNVHDGDVAGAILLDRHQVSAALLENGRRIVVAQDLVNRLVERALLVDGRLVSHGQLGGGHAGNGDKGLIAVAVLGQAIFALGARRYGQPRAVRAAILAEYALDHAGLGQAAQDQE